MLDGDEEQMVKTKADVPSFEKLIPFVFEALKKLGNAGVVFDIDNMVSELLDIPQEIASVLHEENNKQTELKYRLRWARSYLKIAGVITSNSRGKWSIMPEYIDVSNIEAKKIVDIVRSTGKIKRVKQNDENSFIERIEIQYFRSIYRTIIKNIREINVFTGKNDVGKSNVLKALNLFFNNCVVTPGDYKFSDNYNLNRLEEVRQETIKGKQFIQIKVTFRRGKQYEKTLPETFTVTKKWMRDGSLPQITDDIELQLKKKSKLCNDRNRASLTRFLNNIRYVYVPAIKDKSIFDDMLQQLQDTVYTKKLSGNSHLFQSMNELYENVVKTTTELSKEFKDATNIDSMIATPTKINELYHSLKIDTKLENDTISLEDRGDGIRVRYIPSIMNYISINSNEKFIWGFEEPENSLEFNMARKMADAFYEQYKKHSVIFLTTHSPAFIDIGYKDDANGYRCYKKGNNTETVEFSKAYEMQSLSEELGYVEVLQKQFEEYKQLIKTNQLMFEKIDRLKTEIEISRRPIVLTEGKTDAKILKTAWEKLYNYDCPFDIKSCSIVDDETSSESIAGAGILNKTLCTIRWDSVRAVIGLFDNDGEGKKEFALDKNYKAYDGTLWKVNKNKKGYALLLPTNEDTKKIADIGNLSIEFLFDRESISKEIDGKKLKLEPPKQITIINGLKMVSDADDEYWYCSKIVENTKVDFAEYVVPTLEKEKFVNFYPVFTAILGILENI